MDEDKSELALKRRIKIIMFLSIAVFVLLIVSYFRMNKDEETPNIVYDVEGAEDSEYVNPNLITNLDELEAMPELDRAHYYFNKFLFYVEEKEYELAYNLLHDGFKESYFSTLDAFKEFVIKKYPLVNTVSFGEYNKLGRYHILDITFTDILNATDKYTPSFEQKFIILENGLNDYKISFQVEL